MSGSETIVAERQAVVGSSARSAPFDRTMRAFQRNGIYFVLLAVVLAGSIGVDHFLSVSNFAAILRSVALVGIIAIGMTFVVISGHFVDLSVPAQVAGSSLAVLYLQPHGLIVAILGALAAALAIGTANGLLIGVGQGNPIIITLGVQTVAAGVILAVSRGSYVYGDPDSGFVGFGKSSIVSVPSQAIVFLVLILLGQLLLRSTRFGFSLYAIGANRFTARASGLPVERIVALTFVAAALLTGISGILVASYANAVNSSTGLGYEFDALTAVVVGGTSLFGAVGSMWRTLAGVLFIGVVNNLMILVGLPFESQLLVKGLIIIAAVALDALAQRGAQR